MKARGERAFARQIIESRERPSIMVDVRLKDDNEMRASVSFGASTGRHEVLDLRDGDKVDDTGLSARKVVKNLRSIVSATIRGHDALDQFTSDDHVRVHDGIPDLSRLGASVILVTSLEIRTCF